MTDDTNTNGSIDLAPRSRSAFRLGLNLSSYIWPGVAPDRMLTRLIALATAAEQSGFDALFIQDHLRVAPWIGPPTDPVLEGSVVLATVAAHTSRLAVGSYVTPVAFREPAVLARQTTTLDVLSGGRAILGMGSGGFEDEHRAYGLRFGPDRWERLDEAVQICKLMFTQPATTFSGKHYRVEDAYNVPQPIQPGGPPVLIAGVGRRKLLPIVARHADMANVIGDAPTVKRLYSYLDEECIAIGRGPSSILRTYGALGVVGSTDDDARRRAQDWIFRDVSGGVAAGNGLAREDLQHLIGGPETVTERVRRLREAGVESLIVSLGTTAQHPDDVAELGAVLGHAMTPVPTA